MKDDRYSGEAMLSHGVMGNELVKGGEKFDERCDL